MKQGLDGLDLIIKRFQNIDDKMETFVGKAAEKQLDLIADLNREQLQDGIDSAGQIISPPYAESTVQIKKRQGRPWSKVTLFDKGDYYAKLRASKKGGVFELVDSDKKDPDLSDKYGQDIKGLTDQNLAVVSQAMKPDILKSTRNYLLS